MARSTLRRRVGPILGTALLALAVGLPDRAPAGAIFLPDAEHDLLELPRDGALQSVVVGQNHDGFLGGAQVGFAPTPGVWVPEPCPPACDPPGYRFEPFAAPPGAIDTPTAISNTSPGGIIGVSGVRFDGQLNHPILTQFPAADPASFTTTVLPIPNGFVQGAATDVNRNLDVVGFVQRADGTPQAVFWTEEASGFAPTLLDALEAPAISDDGPVIVNRNGGAGMFLNPAIDPTAFLPLGANLSDLTLNAISEPTPDTGEGGVWVLGSTRHFAPPGSFDNEAVVFDPTDPDAAIRIQSTPPVLPLEIGSLGEILIAQQFTTTPKVGFSALGLDPSADPACNQGPTADLPLCDLTQILGDPNQPALRFAAATGTSKDGVIGLTSETFVAHVAYPKGPRVSIADGTVAEGDEGDANLLVFDVSLDRPATEDVTVGFSTADESATIADDDYVAASGTILIPDGSTSTTIEVQIVGDDRLETHETLTVTLVDPENAVISDTTAQGTIEDDDCVDSDGDGICDSLDNCVDVPNSDQQNVDGASDDDSSRSGIQIYGDACDLDVDNDGSVAGSDFFLGFRPCLADPTAFSYCPVFDVDGNGTVDPADFFAEGGFRLSFGMPPGPGLDDVVGPIVSIANGSVAEGGDGDANLVVFTVTLSEASGKEVFVFFRTEDQTARTADADYLGTSGSVVFPVGAVSITIEVPVQGDGVPEADETFRLKLLDATDAVIGDGTAIGTIADDDGPGS